MNLLVQIDGKALKNIAIPDGIDDEYMYLYGILHKDPDVRVAIGDSLSKVVHVPHKLINLITIGA